MSFVKNRAVLMRYIIAIFLICITACQQGGEDATSVETCEGVGVVKAISESQTHINIDHEEIEGFMDAMQMFFPVLDSSVLGGVEGSDSIQFDIVLEKGNYAISEIKVLH